MKKCRKTLSLLLSICMLLTSLQLSSITLFAKAANTITEFTDVNDRSGWTKTSGAGVMEFTDGIGDAGFMTLKSNGNTIFADENAESKQNGFVEMDIQRVKAARFAIIFRYTSPTDWEGVGVDNGNWLYFTGSDQYGNLNSSESTFTADGQKARIRVEYEGKNVKVLVNGKQIISQEVSAFSADKAGKIGFRVWGGITGEGNDDRCYLNVDNVKTSNDTIKDYHVTFTNAADRGNWEKISGKGTLTYQDGEGSNGYALFNADGTSSSVFADLDAPKIANGYFEMKVTNKSAKGRMAIIFRYNGINDWQGIGFDNGNIVGFGSFPDNSDYYTNSLGSFNFPKDTTKTLRVEFEGDTAKLYADGTLLVTHKDSRYTEKAGTIGIRTWGDTDPGSNQIDEITYGVKKTLQKVTLTPAMKDVDYKDIDNKDIEIQLSTLDNALGNIKNGTATLVEGTDYTVNQDKVILKKEYLKSIKEAEQSILKFTFADGFTTNFTLNVIKAEEPFTYTRNFADGIDGFEKVSGTASLTLKDDAAVMDGSGIFVDQNSKSVKNTEVEFMFNPKNDNTNYGVLLRYVSPNEYIYVGPRAQNAQHFTLWGVYTQNGKVADIDDAGYVLGGRKDAYKVKVRLVDNVVTIFIDNEEIYSGQVSGLTNKAGKVGFRTNSGNGMSVYRFTQMNGAMPKTVTEGISDKTIASDNMSVKMDTAFPRVIDYTLKNNAKTTGQEKAIHEVELNNTLYKPEVTSSFTSNSATYHVNVKEIEASFDVIYTVKDNTLEMKIKNIKDEKHKIYTINFPNQSMVSMSSKKTNAKLTVNNYKAQTQRSLSDITADGGYNETTLAVLSSDDIAVTMSGLSYKNRHEVAYKTFDCGDHTSTGLWLNEFTYRGVDGEIEIAEPWAKAAVVTDLNSDNKVDYQDGAIALRDYCRDKKYGADEIVDSWMLVAMNVGSESQYPFLRILDNAKKLNLATDGFKQNIIIKGYQAEGHDSSHPDFANYNKHAGGLEDFNVLLEEAKKFNTKVGIHINHTDVYPEAPQFKDLAAELSAWDWYDSSRCIIRENDDLDKSEKGLDGRMSQLFDKDTKSNIDSVYIDVFFGTRWPMFKLIDNVVGRDIILGTEDVDEMVSFSSFAHGINSFNEYAQKFNQAGNLVRLVDNNQADIFTASPLFRGLTDRNSNSQSGIDGWQNNANLNKALEVFYTQLLPSKYLANFPIMQNTSNTKAVLGENNEVTTEMVNGVNIIKKDGLTIANGNKIFMPWDPKEETKIYHYNQDGGSTTWDLPLSWHDAGSVKLYKLSDEGRSFVKEINVVNNQVTIEADAKTGYVLYKGTKAVPEASASTMDWSTGSLVKDMGFDSHGFEYWSKVKGSDNITIENNNLGNSHLYMSGKEEGSVSQTVTGLVPGQSYSASVWVTTTNGRKATITIDNAGKTLENYVTRSNVVYGYHHNDKYGTYAQRMTVKFVANSNKATLVLHADASDDANSKVDFDDVRIMKSGITNPGKHTYYEDFENVDQGLGIFTSTETDRSHLSQRNTANPEVTPDVISGMYSLKVRAGDYMRTLPSTVRLAPNTTYTVGLDYKSPNANSFTLGIKSTKASEANDTANAVLAQEVATAGSNTKGSLTVKFTTGNYDDYYIDITKRSGTEYFIDNVYVDAAKAMNRETLTELVTQAKAMKEADYTVESFKDVQTAIQQAEDVLNNASATREEIEDAYKNLETAIADAVSYAKEADREVLKTHIKAMKEVLSSDYMEDVNWIIFQATIEEAEELVRNEKATVPQINDMVTQLNTAKQALTPKVDRTAINEILEKAENVDRNIVVDGQVLQTFLSALSNAQRINDKAGVTAKEIQDAVDTLTTAYNAITMKPDKKVDLIEQALEKTKVQEQYFKDSDLAEIKDAKAKLDALSKESTVYIKDYMSAMNQLEKALANKQEKPVLSDTREIDATDFNITSDNQNALTSGGKEGPISLAFDKDPSTHWHTNYTPSIQPLPATVVIDMRKTYTVNQFSYLSREGSTNGNIQVFDLYYMDKDGNWVSLVADGTFKNNGSVEKVKFKPVETQNVKFVVKQGVGGFATAGELAVYEKVADKNALQDAVSAYEKLNVDLYTKDSTATLKKAIDKAIIMLADDRATQDDVDKLVTEIADLNKALELLPTTTDIKALTNAITNAEALHLNDYKDTKAFEAALAEAKKEAENPSTQKSVQNKTFALIQAQQNLEKIANMQALKDAIEAFKKLDQSSYTKDSVDALKHFINEASEMVDKGTASQKEVDTLVQKIKDANAALERIPSNVNLNALRNAIKDFDKMNTSLYTKESVAKLKAYIDEARMLVKQADVTQKEVDSLAAKIKTAKSNLVKAPTKEDIKALKDAIKAAKALDLKYYKDTKAFEKALAEAEKELKTPSSQASVQAKTKALTSAQKALIKGNQNIKPGDKDPGNKKPDTSVKTGDTRPIWLYISTFMISLMGLGFLMVSKRQKKQNK